MRGIAIISAYLCVIPIVGSSQAGQSLKAHHGQPLSQRSIVTSR